METGDMHRCGKALLIAGLLLGCSNTHSRAPADATVAESEAGAGVAASDLGDVLDDVIATDIAVSDVAAKDVAVDERTVDEVDSGLAAFTVSPPQIEHSGSAGYSSVSTITVFAAVDLTKLSVTFSSGSQMTFVNSCPTSLASGKTCTLSVTTCLSGTYSTHQETGQIVIRTGGENSHTVTIPIRAQCYGS
jgi:hypothetical protein